MTREHKAYIIKADSTVQHLSDRPNLTEAQEAVGGYVELLPKSQRSPSVTAFGDEEGRLKGYATNIAASELLGYAVVGDILVLEGWRTLR